MDDGAIIGLFWSRSDKAISALAGKYGSYCFKIAGNILNSREDSEECVNDTYLKVWNAIPPEKPVNLQGFVGKIVRNLAIARMRFLSREKRGGSNYDIALSELEEIIPSGESTERHIEDKEIAKAVNGFISALDAESRAVFVLRYFNLCGADTIAEKIGANENRVYYILRKTRAELKKYLESEGLL